MYIYSKYKHVYVKMGVNMFVHLYMDAYIYMCHKGAVVQQRKDGNAKLQCTWPSEQYVVVPKIKKRNSTYSEYPSKTPKH